MFLGANQDAIFEGEKLGFDRSNSLTYTPKGDFAINTFRSLSEQITSVCKGNKETGFTDIQRSLSLNNEKEKENNYDISNNENILDDLQLKRC